MSVTSKSVSNTISVLALISYCLILAEGDKFPYPIVLSSIAFITDQREWFGIIVLIGLLLILKYGFKHDPQVLKYAYLNLLGFLLLFIRIVKEIPKIYELHSSNFYFFFSIFLFLVLAGFAVYFKFERAFYYKEYQK
jgi:hypothetical protein